MTKNNSEQKKRFLKWLFFGMLFFCSLSALAYFLFFSSFFKIKGFEIVSERKLKYRTEGEIEETARDVLKEKIIQLIPRSNIILMPVSRMKSRILEMFPEIESVEVAALMSGILRIEIFERERAGIWCKMRIVVEEPEPLDSARDEPESEQGTESEDEAESGQEIPQQRVIEECFCMDKNGTLYRESPLVRGSLILNVFDAKERSVGIPSQVVPPEVVSFMLAAKEQLPKINPAVAGLIEEFEFVSVEDVRAVTSGGWEIFFNPAVSLGSQLALLEGILEMDKNFLYIDLRIEGRGYYKIIE